mmetsp:Transcript_447/g.1544  ORF Transcript_447/g.1544 Transcript_447/m.1544 type:complete len:260 (+) Transcript_447:147-926(+)
MKSEDSTKSTQRNSKNSRPRQYKCGACNEEGHNARNCRRRLEQKRGGFPGGETSGPVGDEGSIHKVESDISKQHSLMEMASQMRGMQQQMGEPVGQPMMVIQTGPPDLQGQSLQHGRSPLPMQGNQLQHQSSMSGRVAPGSYRAPNQVDPMARFDQIAHVESNGHVRSPEDRLEGARQAAERVVLDISMILAAAKNTHEYERATQELQSAMDKLEKIVKVISRYNEISRELEASTIAAVDDYRPRGLNYAGIHANDSRH